MTYYKAVRLDRTSHYDQSTLWRVGARVAVDNPDLPSQGPCGRGIHVSPTLLHAVGWQRGPSRYYEVEPETILARDATKARCNAVRVIREIGRAEQDELAGFRLWEANHPHHPLRGPRLPRSNAWLRDRVAEWASVRDSVWDSVRDSVRASVRDSVRPPAWASVLGSAWDSMRDSVWYSVWDSVMDDMGASAWDSAWYSARYSMRDSVRDGVVGYAGSLFPAVTKWCYLPGVAAPWEPLRRLWLAGYVPSYAGKVWRVHTGPTARVVLEVTP